MRTDFFLFLVILSIASMSMVYYNSSDTNVKMVYGTARDLKKRLQKNVRGALPDCCKALTKECLSCATGVLVKDFCERHKGEYGCPNVTVTPAPVKVTSPPVKVTSTSPPTYSKKPSRIAELYNFITNPKTELCKKYHVLKGENSKEPDVRICLDNIKPPCNVISIGIAYNFIFDDFMLKQGCRVWSYDPSMKPGNYKRHARHEFYPIGIGDKDSMNGDKSTLYKNYNRNTIQTKTLDTMMKDMGISYVDIVRIDTESAEWKFINKLNYSKIGQLLIEIHMYKDKESHAQAVLDVPHSLFWSTRNKWDTAKVYKDMTRVYELGFLKKTRDRIMVGIPLYNRKGYVQFNAMVLTKYNKIDSKDIFIFDDASTEYDEAKLREWYGKDIHYFRSNKRLGADENTRRLFTYFSKSNYDILLTLDSDLILDKKWRRFIHNNIDKNGILSLYNSGIHKTLSCDGDLCQKIRFGNAGAVMKKSIVVKMLEDKHVRSSPTFDWAWIKYFQTHGIKMVAPKNSLVLHYGKIGQNNGCNTRELAKGFNRSVLPSWIKARLVFYFDRCSSPNILFKEETGLIIIILSKRNAFNERRAIRETWKRGHNKIFFIVGKPCMVPNPEPWTCNGKTGDINYLSQQNKITEEIKKEKDVVFVDMIDVYRNLAQKLKLAYDWVYKTYGKQYVLKVDLDTFVRVSAVKVFLKNRKKKYECIVGNTATGKVFRSGKWAEHKYRKNVYPPFPSGSGHIISPDLLQYISERRFTFYQGEDTSLGIFFDENGMSDVFTKTTHITTHSGNCFEKNKFIIGHNINPSKMRMCYRDNETLTNTPMIYHDGSSWASKTAEYINIMNLPVKVYDGISTNQDIYLHMYWEQHPPKYSKSMKAKQIFIYGESTTPQVTDIRTLGNTDEEFYYVQQVYSTLPNKNDIFKTRINTGRKFMKYVYTNCVKHRETVYDMISSQIQPVDALGACKTTHGKRQGRWWDKNNKDYKFIIAMENKNSPHYVTEKILMAFLDGAIPIYWGTENVFKMFNKNSFVYFNMKNPEESLNIIKKLSTDENAYKKMLNEPILANGAYEKYFSRKAIHDVIYKKYDTAYNLDYPKGMKTPLSWSQYGQDRYIANLLPRGGYFVEVGGYDGERFSNTLLLEKEYGWNGVLIEANPYTFNILKSRNRKAAAFNNCIGSGSLSFKISGSTTSALETMSEKHMNRINSDIKTYGFKKTGDKRWKHSGETVLVKCKPLLKMVTKTKIDYFSLDVEGGEMMILKSLEWDKLDIRVFSIEVDQNRDEIIRFMNLRGYVEKIRLRGDIIFIKENFLNRKFPEVSNVVINIGSNIDPIPPNKNGLALIFEPVAYKEATLNAKKNDQKFDGTSIVIPAAVSDVPGYKNITFYNSNGVSSSFAEPNKKLPWNSDSVRDGKILTVRVFTLNQILDWIPEHIPIKHLKIDIQGYDYLVVSNTNIEKLNRVESLMTEAYMVESSYKGVKNNVCDHWIPYMKNIGWKIKSIVNQCSYKVFYSDEICNSIEKWGEPCEADLEWEQMKNNIFLDVGSNRGDVIEAFFNKRHRRDSTNPMWKFPINNYNPDNWKVFGFEASPSHVKSLSKWNKRNNVEIIYNAVWTNANETLKLNVDDGKNGAGHAEWGSSLFLDWSKRNDWMKGTGKFYNVKTMDFIAFLGDKIKEKDTVVMKMNIEGTEFKIFEAMKKYNLLCLIDYYQIYWHPSFFDDSNKKKIIVADIRTEILKCEKTKISLWSVH